MQQGQEKDRASKFVKFKLENIKDSFVDLKSLVEQKNNHSNVIEITISKSEKTEKFSDKFEDLNNKFDKKIEGITGRLTSYFCPLGIHKALSFIEEMEAIKSKNNSEHKEIEKNKEKIKQIIEDLFKIDEKLLSKKNKFELLSTLKKVIEKNHGWILNFFNDKKNIYFPFGKMENYLNKLQEIEDYPYEIKRINKKLKETKFRLKKAFIDISQQLKMKEFKYIPPLISEILTFIEEMKSYVEEMKSYVEEVGKTSSKYNDHTIIKKIKIAIEKSEEKIKKTIEDFFKLVKEDKKYENEPKTKFEILSKLENIVQEKHKWISDFLKDLNHPKVEKTKKLNDTNSQSSVVLFK